MMSLNQRTRNVVVILSTLGTLLLIIGVHNNYQEAEHLHSHMSNQPITPVWDIYRARLEDVAAACDRLPAALPAWPLKKVYDRITYAKQGKLAWCSINKVATSSWFENFFTLTGYDLKEVHKPGKGRDFWTNKLRLSTLWPTTESSSHYAKQLADSLKFFIVRHPFDRLLSCYRDKIIAGKFHEKFHHLQNDTVEINNHRSKQRILPTFTDFLYVVRDDMKQIWESGGIFPINTHWSPYWMRCAPCQIGYDVLVRMETIKEDSRFIIEEAGVQTLLNFTHIRPITFVRNRMDNFTSSSEAKQYYFSEVPRSLLQELEQLYHPDMTLFGYSTQTYMDITLQNL